VYPNLAGFAAGVAVKEAWNLQGNARAHKHVVDAGEHRSVYGCRVGQLDLLEEVDADEAVMAFLGQVYLYEIGGHRQVVHGLGARSVGRHLAQQQRLEIMRVGCAFWPEPGRQYPAGSGTVGEGGQASAHVSATVALLQASGHDRVQCGSGNYAQRSLDGYRARQPPVGDADAHAALYYAGVFHRPSFMTQKVIVSSDDKPRAHESQSAPNP
jgi:hypothetical protein